MKSFKVYFHLKINENKDKLLHIKTDELNIKQHNGYDLIKNIIKKINEKKFIISKDSIKYVLSIKDCDESNNNDFYKKNYELKIGSTGDNDNIKDNSSNFPLASLLKNIVNRKIFFDCQNPLNIMLTEKFSDFNTDESNNTSTILNKKKDKYYNKCTLEYLCNCICFYNVYSNVKNYI